MNVIVCRMCRVSSPQATRHLANLGRQAAGASKSIAPIIPQERTSLNPPDPRDLLKSRSDGLDFRRQIRSSVFSLRKTSRLARAAAQPNALPV